MLISGDLVLDFFDRNLPSDPDLEVWVEHPSALDIGRWFLTIGYIYIPSNDRFRDFKAAHIRGTAAWIIEGGINITPIPVRRFIFRNRLTEKTIILRTVGGSPLQAILNFPSTCTMNIVSHDVAVSFYPRATFE
ncbi:hypothetical protein Hypma_014203 [Hypsizygus marmoreus]|uniref:Uncharacterized protein n=1 Tax=Hypsizygus marmoreus TaxID=39966 RepID=A0A369JK52_HYPMA|nr:hypothetical protein Hypma_014203 [Hypsizygus marmoreus]